MKHISLIPNVPSVCRSCEENDYIKNGLIKSPTHVKKKQFHKIPCRIDEFHKVHYQKMLKKYEYHRMLLCLLGKNECKNIRNKVFFR